MADFVDISKEDIPDYLKKSKLYEHLDKDEENNKELSIPKQFFKKDLTIENFGDFILLMNTFKYWTVYEIPYIIYEFVDDNKKLFYDKIDNLVTRFKNMKFTYEIETIIKHQNIPERAAQFGFLDLIRYCVIKKVGGEPKYSITETVLNIASYKGHINILEYLNNPDLNINITNNTLKYAIKGNKLECIKYIHEIKNINFDDNDCNMASLIGNIDVLKYIYGECGVKYNNNPEILSNTVFRGPIECAKYLVEEIGVQITSKCLEEASLEGKLEFLQYFVEKGGKDNFTKEVANNAALNSHTECVKYCLENGCDCSDIDIELLVSDENSNNLSNETTNNEL